MRVRTVGRFMVVTAVVALLGSVGGGIAGLILINELDATFGRSLDLTVEAVAAVDDSLEVAAETLALVDEGLTNTQDASTEVVDALRSGADLLRSTADLTEEELAPSITAVERSLPNIVTVASAVDSALSGLSQLPLGISYDPSEGLDESLRDLQTSLAGTGQQLGDQSQLIREASNELVDVADGTETIAGDLIRLDSGIADARSLVDEYAQTADSTGALIADTRSQLDARSTAATVMVVLLALAVGLGQLAPLYIGRQLVRHADEVEAVLGTAAGRSPA